MLARHIIYHISLLRWNDPLILSENVSVIAIADLGPKPGDTVRVFLVLGMD